MNRLGLAAIGLFLVAGCQSKGPAPKEAPPPSAGTPAVGTTETGGAHPSTGTPADPHAGLAAPADPHGDAVTPKEGVMDVGPFSFKAPPQWKWLRPTSSMRRAQFAAPGSAGDADLIVYFFGAQGAGSAKANIERWVGQFSNEDGSPITGAKPIESKVAGFKVTKLEVAGRYAGGMGTNAQQREAKRAQRLIATIVETEGGPYYFKLLGPDKTVAENRAAFDGLLASIEPSP